MSIEGHFSEKYFKQILRLIPETARSDRRRTFKAYDSINNIFNLGYGLLSWKVHHALVKAKLEPYLGFLHSIAKGKPSLICDFMELYRYLVDDFIIQFCRNLRRKDFIVKSEILTAKRRDKREYLNNLQTSVFMKNLNQYFQSKVSLPRMRKGDQQEIETLISEEAFAQYLRDENWIPRISILN